MPAKPVFSQSWAWVLKERPWKMFVLWLCLSLGPFISRQALLWVAGGCWESPGLTRVCGKGIYITVWLRSAAPSLIVGWGWDGRSADWLLLVGLWASHVLTCMG